jgi:hypothetical protein
MNTVYPESLLFTSYAAKILKRKNNKIVDYHIIMDHCQSLNYNQINQHIKELETKKVRISIRQLSNILVKSQKILCAQHTQKNQSLVQLLIDLSNFKEWHSSKLLPTYSIFLLNSNFLLNRNTYKPTSWLFSIGILMSRLFTQW